MWCERVFAPDTDMEAMMRKEGIPLFGLESRDPIRDFDMVGFTLQYEMSYTAILNMLDLAGIPLRTSQRTGLAPMIIAGRSLRLQPGAACGFYRPVRARRRGRGQSGTGPSVFAGKERRLEP